MRSSRSIVASRFGRVLRGTRENAVRMEAIGFQPFRYQLAAYVISGMMAGLAGCLLANQAEFVSPAFMTWQRSGELIFMVVLGGLGSLHGAIIGAAAFLLLEEFLPEILHTASFFLSDEIRAHLAENWKMVFGPLLILIVLFARGGIMGLLRRGRTMAEPLLELRNLRKSLRRARRHRRCEPRPFSPASCTPSSARTAPARRR